METLNLLLEDVSQSSAILLLLSINMLQATNTSVQRHNLKGQNAFRLNYCSCAVLSVS